MYVTDEAKTVCFNDVISIITYWIGIENSNCSAAMIKLAEELDLSIIEKKRLSRTINMFNSMFPELGGYTTYKNSIDVDIPDNMSIDNDSKYFYIMANAIQNFISAEIYSEAYKYILDCSNFWPDLYKAITKMIRSDDKCDDFCVWCCVHSIIAMDIKETTMFDLGSLAIMYDEDGFKNNDGTKS